MAGAGGVVAAADVQGEPDQAVEGGDGAGAPVVGPQPAAAAGI